MYQEHDLTKDRVMLVDEDLVFYFMNDRSAKTTHYASMSPSLLHEHHELLDGYGCGSFREQELEFDRLFQKNISMKHPLTLTKLQNIQRQAFGSKGSVQVCYCQTKVSQTATAIIKETSSDYVGCSYQGCEFGGIFHKRCVKKLGIEKVSRWYCTACEKHMKALAYRTLGIPLKEDTAIMSNAEDKRAVKDVAKIFKSRLQKLQFGDTPSGLEIGYCD